MLGFCSIQNVRDVNAKFIVSAISDDVVTTQITTAEDIIISNLSGLFTESDLTAAIGSKVLQELALYKSMEMCLVYLHGYTRQIDSTTDVDYWMKKYNELLKKILSGDIIIGIGGTDYTPVNIPKITADVDKIFTDRGLDGFDTEFDSNENI